ncbi:MAG TPA: Rrf2 family transcriptional regulator [Anaerolineaceae bacterium]|nr:Rrf2 family transcriptional regulator [Anaerolineaceae bacterium]
MEITHQADYALRAIMYLAKLGPGQRVSTSQIAEKNNIPPSFLTKIVSQLSIAGLIHTSRGAHGGVWLARSPESITLLEVLEAIDGSVNLNHCVADPGICSFSDTCVLHVFWQDACHTLVERLKATNFGNLAAKPASELPAAA